VIDYTYYTVVKPQIVLCSAVVEIVNNVLGLFVCMM